MKKIKILLCILTLLLCASASWGADTYSSTTAGTHALSLTTGDESYSDITVTKTGDQSGQSDDYDWKGTNAAVHASGGGTLMISGSSTITSKATYGNAVFSYGGNLSGSNSGDGTTIDISDATIVTTKNNSGGIMVTGGGKITASNLTITTSGGSSAAIRSDKGGGTIEVDGGTYTTSGTGSPAIYSTAEIIGDDITLKSNKAQVVVIEGGNSVTLTDSTLTANHNTLNGQDTTYQAVLIYQSQSGDASDGASTFTMTGGSITNTKGDIFHVTNTTTTITLEDVSITNNDSSGYFLRASSDSWGSSGSNGGKVTMKATDQTIRGIMLVDSVSTLALTLSGSSTFRGAINTSGQKGTVSVNVGSDSTWRLTANSYVSSLTNNGTIVTGDYTLYVNGTAYTGGVEADDDDDDDETSDTSGGTAPTITTTELKDATVGKSYSVTLKATGDKPITWSTDTDSLPAGMTFTSGGKLSGKPDVYESYALDFTANNSAGSDTVTLTLNVNDVAPKIKGSVKAGAIDVEYSAEFSLSAGTGDITWSLDGGLPNGLEFDSDGDTATLSGTPTEAWDGKITVSAANSGGTASKTYTLKVKAEKPKINTKTLEAVNAGETMSASIDITGTEPITVTVTGAPDGVTYNSNTGELTGTPETAGKYSVKITAENDAGKASKTLKLVVNSEPEIKLDSTTLDAGTSGISYNYTFKANGSTPITWSVDDADNLPAGLKFTNKGKLTGKPTGSGTYTFAVTAANSYGTDTKDITLTINPVAAKITTSSLKTGNYGKAYSLTLKASGTTPITWTLTGDLPEGLDFDADTATLSGTPNEVFTGNVTVTADNAANTPATRIYTLKIKGTAPTIKTKSLSSGRVNTDYSATLTATGTPDITWSWDSSSAPSGLEIDSDTGKISGVPLSAGTYKVKISATNDVKTVSKTFKIVIASATSASSISAAWSRPAEGRDAEVNSPNSGHSLPKDYEIAYELGTVSVDVSGMYDMNLELDENAKAGAELFWLARPQNAAHSDDDTIAEFSDRSGQEIRTVPRNRKITVSAWLNKGVIYSPVIAVKKQ